MHEHTQPHAFCGTHYPFFTCRYDGEARTHGSNSRASLHLVSVWIRTVHGQFATPEIPGQTCDDDGGLSGADMLGDLINYGSRPGEWRPGGGDHVPDGCVGDGAHDRNLDTDYLGMPDLTSFCTSCREIRPGEGRLSHVEARPSGEPFRVCDQLCMRCVRSDPPEDM